MMTEELKEYLMKKYINSEISKKLYDILNEIWQNDEFIFGVITDLKNEEKQSKMIKLLENGLKDTDEINLHALAMDYNVEVEEMREMIKSIDWSKRQVFHREPKE